MSPDRGRGEGSWRGEKRGGEVKGRREQGDRR